MSVIAGPARHRRGLLTFLCLLPALAVADNASTSATPLIPLEVFARAPNVTDVTISPDGRYLASIHASGDRRGAVVIDLKEAAPTAKPVLMDDGKKATLRWCNWPTNTRLVCGYSGVFEQNARYFTGTRLVAVDADGKNQKVLIADSEVAGGQYQDRIIDWHPGKPDTILVLANASLISPLARMANASVFGRVQSSEPAVYELNVVTGGIRQVIEPFAPIWSMLTDYHGHVRVGFGVKHDSTVAQYFARTSSVNHWHPLLQFKVFDETHDLLPTAMDRNNTDRAFAIGDKDGRKALWAIDLTDRTPPSVIYSNAYADVGGPIVLKDGTFIGVHYNTERPHAFYSDPQFATLMDGVDAALPDTFNAIVDATADRSTLVVHSTSDRVEEAYFLFDVKNNRIQPIADENTDLNPAALGRMLAIHFTARDGTEIPGYLTRPPGMEGASNLPLIVMPHDGPIARNWWHYYFLQQFLVNRGYAVLQINFRGSSGFGYKWMHAAHQDWGGLTYDDVIDGTRWALKTGIADPKRVGILGWGFGGYIAELAATRNGDLFRCAVSIAGVSDLKLLENSYSWTNIRELTREQIGTNREKLAADSPRRHADGVSIPILLIHGTTDPQVGVEESQEMVASLKKANKPYEYLELKEADHQIVHKDDRTRLLEAVERQLNTSMPAR